LKKDILISSRSFGKVDSEAVNLLKEEEVNVISNKTGKKLTEEQILNYIYNNNIVGIVAGTEKISKKIIDSAKNLSVISRYGVGINNIDQKCAKKKGILVFNTPKSPSISVAELTLALILNLNKKITLLDKRLKNQNWEPELGHLLSNKTIGIIGLGRIGKKLVEFLSPFEVNTLVYDIKPNDIFISKWKLKKVSFKTLIKESDIISVHIPLSKKTKYLIDKKEISLMKKNAILINTSRGGIINEDALYNALKNKKIYGAAIDAFENEPNVGRLINLDNIILTPHIGTFTAETRKEMEIESINNLIYGLKKKGIL